MPSDFLVVLPFLALPFIFNAVVQFVRQKHELRTWGGLLALLAFIAPLLSIVFNGLREEPNSLVTIAVSGNIVAVLVISLLMLVLELRKEEHNLNRSFGVIGVGIGVLLFTLLFAIEPLTSYASSLEPTLANSAATETIPSESAVASANSETDPEETIVERQEPSATPTVLLSATPLPERTPMPTATPTRVPFRYATPTPTPTRSPEQGCQIVTTANLNIRSGASTEYPIMDNAPMGTELTAIGKSIDSSWFQVEYGFDAIGWVSGDYVNTITACDQLQIPE